MKKIGIVISSLWLITQCFFIYGVQAAYPTIEGLFRNGDNKDLIGDYVTVKMMIKEVQNEEILRRIKVAEGDEIAASVITREEEKPQYVKLIYSIEGEARADLLKVEYFDVKMKKRSLKSSTLIKGVRRQIKKDENHERALFNSILIMLFLNDSKEIMAVLHGMGIALPTSPMMMNAEKINLLNEYKKYLLAIKEDQSLKEELLSPLKPVDEDEKKRVDEILKSNMYKKSENLSLIKEKNKFFWKLKQGSFEAYFRNKKHRLDRIQAEINGKMFSMNFGEYVLFNGVHELPTQVLVRDTRARVYKIKMLALNNFVNNGKSLYERSRDYKKIEEEMAKGRKEKNQEITAAENNFELLY